MLLEKLFGNIFGVIWLLVFLVAVLVLIIWLIAKKEKDIVIDEENELVEENIIEEEVVEEQVSNSIYEIVVGDDGFYRVKKIGEERTLRKFNKMEDAENYISEKENAKEKIEENNKSSDEEISKTYEIINGDDGFYRVRKIGTERTLRKFSSEKEALDFINEKESK